ncbi:MAG: CHAT domain-containing protein, partial [Pseudomonadota bacterium]
FEHRTLTASPIDNAIALLEALPVDAELTLLSHSRGGLIGELLARAGRGDPFDDFDLRIFSELGREDDLRALERLSALLKEKRPNVRHIVRVACPARGTILASERLDLYLSVFLNLMRLIPGPQSAFVAPFRLLLKRIVASRTDADTLPGLEAMMPEAPLTAILNRPDLTLPGDLTIIGGDIEPGGLLQSLAVVATDLFFREDHDVVVNTEAMLGGITREGNARFYIGRGRDVSHFSYFRNRETADRIVGALAATVAEAGFEPLRPAMPSFEATSASRGGDVDGKKPVVFLLPGIMGSELSLDGRRYWANPFRLVFGGITTIGAVDGMPAEGVSSTGAIDTYYGRLAQHLSASHDVVVFHYDWRLSLVDEARRFQAELASALDRTSETQQPVRILAHSMGGLLARTMIANHRETWDRLLSRNNGGRLVMLGTPNGGSVALAAGLLGRDPMIRKLALADIRNNLGEVLNAITPLPGILELLPTDLGHRYFQPELWDELSTSLGRAAPRGWRPPPEEGLKAALELHKSLELSDADRPHMVYVAGKADVTPVSIETEPFRVMGTANGDGRVTWRTGMLPGVETYFAPDTIHGDLPSDESLFPAITDLVQRGTTALLSQSPPASRAAEHIFEVPLEPVLYPDLDEFGHVGMGGGTRRRVERGAGPRVHVKIEHGDLRLQPGTIAVGHYANSPLISAEHSLDLALDGRLSLYRSLDLYPGDNMTAELFQTQPDGSGPDGALIVGLGEFGALTRGALTANLVQAFQLFALRTGRGSDHGERGQLTTLLIGHRDSVLTVRECLRALLEAIRITNQRLPRDLALTEITILEFFEDTAVEASEILSDLARAGHFQEAVNIDPMLRQGRAGRQRYSFGREPEWEQKIRIRHEEAKGESEKAKGESEEAKVKSLTFESLSRGALTSRIENSINRARVDRHMAKAMASTSADDDTGALLFQFLIPEALKSTVSDGRNLTLLLDAEAAAYPWELMRSPRSLNEEPIAVSGKLMRQLADKPNRNRPPLSTGSAPLVIGDPKSEFVALPGAKQEAIEVAEMFTRAGFVNPGEKLDVISDPTEVERLLFLGEHRLLHFAGHGVQENKKTGMVIGKDDLFTPEDARSIYAIPEFVFLNCCHVGRVEVERKEETDDAEGEEKAAKSLDLPGRAKLAANLAIEFMKLGSKAVIAAGWEVEDTAALIFSRTFYAAFLNGTPFGRAIHEAREATYKHNPNIDTWGAYQCYGDPQYRASRASRVRRAAAETPQFSALRQAVLAMRSLRADAQFAKTEAEANALRAKLSSTLKGIEASFPASQSAALLEAIGLAVAEIGDRDTAIAYLTRAAGASPASISVASVEECYELQVRRATAQRLVAEASGDGDLADKMRDAEQNEINEMLTYLGAQTLSGQVGMTAQRAIRIGDTLLRRAATYPETTKKAYRDALKAAAKIYEDAEELMASGAEMDVAHPRLRRAAAEYFLGLELGQSLSQETVALVRSVITALGDIGGRRRTFERARIMAEARLFMMLTEPENGPEDRDAVIEGFDQAFLCGASLRRRMETVDDHDVVARHL